MSITKYKGAAIITAEDGRQYHIQPLDERRNESANRIGWACMALGGVCVAMFGIVIFAAMTVSLLRPPAPQINPGCVAFCDGIKSTN